MDRSVWNMEDAQPDNRGYIICHQCITDSNKVSRQMRPVDDWKDCEWYNEAKSTAKPKPVKPPVKRKALTKNQKLKKSKKPRKSK